MWGMSDRSPTASHPARDDATVHRALSSRVRGRLLQLLRDAASGLDVRELADRLDLHVNTVRGHLTVLEEAGLVVSEPEARDRPGRPRLVYVATADGQAAAPAPQPGYRLLAEVLASYLSATSPDAAAGAVEAGRAWGRYLTDGPPPFRTVSADEGIDSLAAMLDDLGFAPEVDDTSAPGTPRVLLRRCPFLDVAREHQDVVCSVHLGLMRGALDELGVPVAARDLLPFVEPDLCVTELEVRG